MYLVTIDSWICRLCIRWRSIEVHRRKIFCSKGRLRQFLEVKSLVRARCSKMKMREVHKVPRFFSRWLEPTGKTSIRFQESKPEVSEETHTHLYFPTIQGSTAVHFYLCPRTQRGPERGCQIEGLLRELLQWAKACFCNQRNIPEEMGLHSKK